MFYRKVKHGIKYGLSFFILISCIISPMLKYWEPPLLKTPPKQLYTGAFSFQQHILLHFNLTLDMEGNT